MKIKSISFKLFLILLTTISLIQIASHLINASIMIEDERERLEKNITLTKTLFNSNIVLPLYNYDFIQIETIMESLFIYDEIIGVEINDMSKMSIQKYKNPITGELSKDMYFDYIYKSHTYKIDHNNIIIGEVKIFITDYFIKQRTLNFIKRNLISILFLLLSTLTITILSINFILNKPLKFIIKKIEDISSGNYNADITIKGCNELTEIDNSIVQMSKTIQTREKEILNSRNEIKELQLYLKNIIESLPSIIISINDEYKITQWNRAAENFTGVDSLRAIGKNCFELLPFIVKYKEYIHDVSMMHSSIEFKRESEKIFDKTIYYNIGIYPLHALSIKGCVIRIDDTTEIELKEMQLQQTQKIDMIGILAGGLAHDFNNVLGAISGTVSLLDLKIGKSNLCSIELDELLNIIKDATKRAIDMVQQLLFLSRKQERKMVQLDINQVIKNVEKLCDNTFDKQIHKEYHYSETPLFVEGDNTGLQQVFLNLFINAYHAMTIMRDGKETDKNYLFLDITDIYADKFFAKSHVEAKDIHYVKISVRDTGVGMESKSIAKIFDPFYTTKPEGKGTGLGLSVVYSIVKNHDGFIDVYSEVGIGTTFTVYLPLADSKNLKIISGDDEKIIKGKGNVLVIDDDEYLRVIAKKMLEECGYTVYTAEIGDEGVELFSNIEDIDLILLDMNMPEKSGKEILTELQTIDNSVKVIITSGFSFDKRIKESLESGAVDFLHKPYSIKQLSETISKHINPL